MDKTQFPIILSGRSLICVSGAEAAAFLNATITADISALAAGELRPAALLSPQGKILFDFLIARLSAADGDSFQIDIAADSAAAFTARLYVYRLRRQAEISAAEPVSARISAAGAAGALRDRRFPANCPVWRSYAGAAADEPEQAAWDRLRIACCLPEGGRDFVLGEAFPHDVNYDALSAVSFRKGCYIGQEVVSRMQHKAVIRKRLARVMAEQNLPPEGAEILINGKIASRLGTVSGRRGLALIRLDRLAAASGKAEAAGAPLRFAPPPYLPQLFAGQTAEE